MTDIAEERANEFLEGLDFQLTNAEFENVCDIFEDLTLTKRGTPKSMAAIKVGRVCTRIGEAPISDQVRLPLLLEILKNHIRNLALKKPEELDFNDILQETTP